jgi:hypothetical protein
MYIYSSSSTIYALKIGRTTTPHSQAQDIRGSQVSVPLGNVHTLLTAYSRQCQCSIKWHSLSRPIATPLCTPYLRLQSFFMPNHAFFHIRNFEIILSPGQVYSHAHSQSKPNINKTIEHHSPPPMRSVSVDLHIGAPATVFPSCVDEGCCS